MLELFLEIVLGTGTVEAAIEFLNKGKYLQDFSFSVLPVRPLFRNCSNNQILKGGD